ncbi:hypothetical protein D3C78_1634440 [compost metagenome]
MGSRFSAISTRLTFTPAMAISNQKLSCRPLSMNRRSDSAHRIAMNRLAAGPASATHSMSFLGRRRRPKSTGTGLAQPNSMPGLPSSLDASRMAIGTSSVPTGSICRTGFRLMRPAS